MEMMRGGGNKENETFKPKKGKSNMPQPKKRIYNPVTETYYEIRQRSTSRGNKGTIKGKYKR